MLSANPRLERKISMLSLFDVFVGAIIGALLTQIIPALLPGSIIYKLNLYKNKVLKWIKNVGIKTSVVWKIFPASHKKLSYEEFLKEVSEALTKNRIKYEKTNDGIKFTITYGKSEYEGKILSFAEPEERQDIEYIKEVNIYIENTISYRTFAEELLEIFNAFEKVKKILYDILETNTSDVIVECELKGLEAFTGILKDLKVNYMMLGDTYQIDLSQKRVTIIKVIDKAVLQLLKNIIALYG